MVQLCEDVEFDFEESVQALLPKIEEAPVRYSLEKILIFLKFILKIFSNTNSSFGLGSFGRVDPKLRTVVCRHWLQGLCQFGDKCDYLNKLDKSRMPPCKHGKNCKIKNCPLKHVDEGERPGFTEIQ